MDKPNHSSLRFVPEMLVDYVNKRNKDVLEPASFFFHGVCLLVDISGFTKLSGDFCKQGKGGIDDLQLATNGFMGRLVEIIYSFGGDIIKFAGDAIVCVFSADFITSVSTKVIRQSINGFESFKFNNVNLAKSSFEHSPIKNRPQVTAEVILRVMHCSRVLREVQTDKLTVHVAMSCGEMCFGILGGFESRWKCLVSGPCIHQISGCLDDAPSKTAVMTSECFAILANSLQESVDLVEETCESQSERRLTVDTNTGSYTFEVLKLISGNFRIVEVECASTIDALTTAMSKADVKPKAKSSNHLDLIKLFLPVQITEELEHAESLNLISEIREVTTMFMKWDSYEPEGKHRNLIELQSFLFQAQRILISTGAYLRQFLVDDKGCVLIACWGTPHLSYLDNAYRAVSAAAQIKHDLNKLGMACSFGITTGDVYCGMVGSALRMEYAAIGSPVNMSARLMGKANGSILVDDATYSHLKLSAKAVLTKIDPIKVKGRDEPLQVFQYSGSGSLTSPEKVVEDHEIPSVCRMGLTTLIQGMAGLRQIVSGTGRFDRSNWFSWYKRSTANSSHTTELPIHLIQGKPGSGRTTVVTWLKAQAVEYSLFSCAVRLNKKDSHVEYGLWKKIFIQLMPKDLYASNSVQRSYIQNLILKVYGSASRRVLSQGCPVLKTYLGVTCDFQTLPSIRQSGSVRNSISKSFRSISMSARVGSGSMRSGSVKIPEVQAISALLKIFSYLLSAQTTLVIIENIELADEDSLKLLMELAKTHSRSAIVCTAHAEVGTGDAGVRMKSASALVNAKELKTNAFNNTAWSKHFKEAVLQNKSTTSIMLEAFTPEEIDKMLAVALGVRVVPAEISQLVQDFSGGSYFWIREIIQFLKEHGTDSFISAIKVDLSNDKVAPAPLNRQPSMQRSFSRAPSFKQVAERRFSVAPHQQQLDKLVLCRFGNMSPDIQRVLRTASIIGMTFSGEVLQGVLPVHLRSSQSDCLESLLRHKWIYQDSEINHLYQFAHAHSHQIIYELTPSSERNNLHQLIADHLETKFSVLTPPFSSLCYHYSNCDNDKALRYAVKATAVMIETENIFDFGDCLDLLTGLQGCCKTIYDVEVLQQLVNTVRDKIETIDVTPARPSEQLGWLRFLQCSAASGCSATVFPSAGGGAVYSKNGNSPVRLQTVLSDDEDDQFDGMNLDGEENINYEQRTKRLLLQQINKYRNSLCEKYVDFSEDREVTNAPKDWQRAYLRMQ